MWRHTGSDGSFTNQYRKQWSHPLRTVHSVFAILRIFHTPHFAHSSFSNLLIFCAPHFLHFANSTLSTPRISPNPLLATIFLIKVFVPLSNRPHKTTKSFLQDLLEVFLEFTPNRLNSKVKCVHCRWPGRNDKLCTRLFSLATYTSVLIACISCNNLWYTLDKSAVKIGRRVLFPSAHVFQIAISSASLKIFFSERGGHWALWFCGIGQFFLGYVGGFNFEIRYYFRVICSKLDIHSSGYGMTSRVNSADWRAAIFGHFCVRISRYLRKFFEAVQRCSESPKCPPSLNSPRESLRCSGQATTCTSIDEKNHLM